MAAEILYTIHFYVLFLLLTVRISSSFIGNGDNYRRNVSLELNPDLNSLLTPLPPGVGLVHVRALGKNTTLHYLLCNQGAQALLLVHTSSTSSKVEVDWPAFLFSAFDSEGRDQGWPSLLHNANSSQLRVGLDGVAPRSNRSRFSLELQAVGGTQPMALL
ncbi:glycosylated lysosomal membrane protein-like [Coregonus clupeaformis]|uniref:glycosylated lysosomal membrane protein-like n=1 Tax=Coregonus clupeaformis TaxID=59861 RepID=UPI001BE05D9D|nr:glycosylated lysosomal membrane protein-like [Coregonus clupeaformis]